MSDMHNYKNLLKMNGRVLPTVAIQLLKSKKQKDKKRDTSFFHPSELAKRDWCPRASWYTIKNEVKADENFSFQRLNVFEEGHAIHHKWQTWLWEAGVLEGNFRCGSCKHLWWDLSPNHCPECGSTIALSYAEVPVKDEEYGIRGSADGIVSDKKGRTLIEIKSVGIGTVRFEDFDLYKQYEENPNMGIDGLWKKIRQPFPSHVRQGMLYMHCTGIHDLTFIYEWKPSQEVKEFSIKYLPHLVQPILDSCRVLLVALQQKIPPMRPAWAETATCSGCKYCPYKNTCWSKE